jgi:hypothetical protein
MVARATSKSGSAPEANRAAGYFHRGMIRAWHGAPSRGMSCWRKSWRSCDAIPVFARRKSTESWDGNRQTITGQS